MIQIKHDGSRECSPKARARQALMEAKAHAKILEATDRSQSCWITGLICFKGDSDKFKHLIGVHSHLAKDIDELELKASNPECLIGRVSSATSQSGTVL